jgi:transposase InsO family protein
MLHERGDKVAFRVKSAEEEEATSSGTVVGVIVHTDVGGHYIRAAKETLCCDHYVADWELMSVKEALQ